MSQRYPDDASRSSAAYADDRSGTPAADRRDASRRRGPHLGPVRITPVRVTLLIALVGGIGFLLYATFVRDQLQVPMMATGFAICGLVFAAVAVLARSASCAPAVRAATAGRWCPRWWAGWWPSAP